MNIDFLIKNFEKNKNHDALIYLNKIYKYEWIVDKIKYNNADRIVGQSV